jgi:hypothetical protein
VAELDAYARLFGLDAKVFVSKPAPDANQLALAAMMDGVVLLSEDPNTEYGTAVVDERTIDLHRPLSIREQLMVSSFRGMSYLHQRVKGQARQDPMPEGAEHLV